MAKIFFISPVRLATPGNTEACKQYVEKLEKQGHCVWWPKRDNPHQKTDPVGMQICDTNLGKILEADEIHIWFVPTSTGIHFDFGATYMLVRILGYKKRIIFVNRDEFAENLEILARKGEKDYQRVLDYLDKETSAMDWYQLFW